MLNKLGKRLKQVRIDRGHQSLEKFAFSNDISRVLYSNYEAGKGNVTFKNLTKVLNALDMSYQEFFSEGF